MAFIIDSLGRLPVISFGLCNDSVQTISDIRHANLLSLIERAGNIQSFADKIERSHSQVSQLKNKSKHSKSGLPREIGDDMARHIEQSFNLPLGWMDQIHGIRPAERQPSTTVLFTGERAGEPATGPWPFRRISVNRVLSLSSADIARIEGYIEAVIAQADSSTDHGQGAAA